MEKWIKEWWERVTCLHCCCIVEKGRCCMCGKVDDKEKYEKYLKENEERRNYLKNRR